MNIEPSSLYSSFDTPSFLSYLQKQGVHIEQVDGFLDIDGNDAVMNDELVQEIKKRKAAILSFLSSVVPLPAPTVNPGQHDTSKSERIEIHLHKKLSPEKVIAIAQKLQQVGVTFTPSFGYIKMDASFPLLGNPHLTAAAVHTWAIENEPVLIPWVEQQQGFHTSSIA